MTKTLRAIGEFGLIERIKRKTPAHKNLLVGIGDDAAVLKLNGKSHALLTTDVLVEGVDFSFRTVQAKDVGRKALAVNLSDVAAMGGHPDAALIGLVVPPSASLKMVDRFYDGFLRLAKQFQVAVAGGDLSSGPCWMIAVSIFGSFPGSRPVFLLRSGARPGDLICVTGSLGGSILRKHYGFTPRIREGQFLGRFGVHSMIDVSDGLVQDLQQMLEASRVGAELWLEKIPVSNDAKRLGKTSKKSPLLHALSDGEDFELLFTVAPNQLNQLTKNWLKKFRHPFYVIGKVTGGHPEISFMRNNKQICLKLSGKGYTHF